MQFVEIPTQVMFFDKDEEVWSAGIAYRDVIISAEYGNAIPIDQFLKDNPAKPAIIPHSEWFNFEEYITDYSQVDWSLVPSGKFFPR